MGVKEVLECNAEPDYVRRMGLSVGIWREKGRLRKKCTGKQAETVKLGADMQKHGSSTACFPPLPTRAWIFTFYFIFLCVLCLIYWIVYLLYNFIFYYYFNLMHYLKEGHYYLSSGLQDPSVIYSSYNLNLLLTAWKVCTMWFYHN